jgi:hypothetical protein
MADIRKKKLSGSTNGRNIKVAASATAGTLIHTAVNVTDQLDEVWVWAQNTSALPVKLTIELGGVTSPDDHIEITIQAEDGPVPVIPGWVFDGGVAIRAFAATVDVIVLNGFVNRLAQVA